MKFTRLLTARKLTHQLNLLKPQVEAYQATTANAQSKRDGAIGASQIAKVEGVLHDE